MPSRSSAEPLRAGDKAFTLTQTRLGKEESNGPSERVRIRPPALGRPGSDCRFAPFQEIHRVAELVSPVVSWKNLGEGRPPPKGPSPRTAGAGTTRKPTGTRRVHL